MTQDVIYPRKFRWILESNKLPPHFMKDVTFDYVNKTIVFNYYDAFTENGEGLHAIMWAENISPNDTLIFKSLSSCGEVLQKLTFSDLQIISHIEKFDYVSSDVATSEVAVQYGKLSLSK